MDSKCQQVSYIGMDPEHRKIILENIEKLIDETQYMPLVRECHRAGVLNQAMINKIESVSVPRRISEISDDEALKRERHRQLFMKLTKRGPDAYQKLREILVRLGYDVAVRLLHSDNEMHSIRKNLGRPIPTAPPDNNNSTYDGSSESKQTRNTNSKELRPYTGEPSPRERYEVIKSTCIQRGCKAGVYEMKSKHNRGVFFMVNIIDFHNNTKKRDGAKEDGEALLYLFKEFDFTLFSYINLTQKDFFHYLEALLQSDVFKNAECFVMALMSHGNMDKNDVDHVEFADGSVVKVHDILAHFRNEICPSFISKPKVFIFPFCRGTDIDRGYKLTQADGYRSNPAKREYTTSLSDILVCYAADRGHSAHRNVEKGSWYIQNFYKNMAEHAHDTDFEEIIKITQREVSTERSETGAMQNGNYHNINFSKRLYFNPGFYEDVEIKEIEHDEAPHSAEHRI